MSFRTFFAASVLVAAPLAACAPGSSIESTEDNVVEEGELSVDTVYVVTRQDFKKCAYPMCGGVYVKALNKNKTKCFDGSLADDCYVGDVDLASLELPETQAGDVRSQIIAGEVLVSGELGLLQSGIAKLVARKAYEPETGNDATGTFYLVEPSGITCITAPCPSLHARKLNSTSVKQVTDVDMSGLGLTEEQISDKMSAIFTSNLIVSGTLKNVATPQGTEKRLTVTEIFSTVEAISQELCLSHDACGEGRHCDFSECLSDCPPGMVCPAVCHGACVDGEVECPSGGAACESLCGGEPIDFPEGCPIPSCQCPQPVPGSCFQACGGGAPDDSCYCDADCEYYGDCCSDYVSECL